MRTPLIQDFDLLPDSAHVRIHTVAKLFAVSLSTVRRAVKAGRIPNPLKHFDRAVCWNVGQLRRALKGQGPNVNGWENQNE